MYINHILKEQKLKNIVKKRININCMSFYVSRVHISNYSTLNTGILTMVIILYFLK